MRAEAGFSAKRNDGFSLVFPGPPSRQPFSGSVVALEPLAASINFPADRDLQIDASLRGG
jgi:hypothetical protein